MAILFGITLIILGLIFYKYTLQAEKEDREYKEREKGIAVMLICSGILLIILYLITLAS